MKIAVCQINPTVADLSGNVNRILEMAFEAAALNPDIIVFPELALPGCHPKDILFDTSFFPACKDALSTLDDQLDGFPPVILGTIEKAGHLGENRPGLGNAAVLLGDQPPTVVSCKKTLWSTDVADEQRWFCDFMEPEIFTVKGKRVAVLVGGESEAIRPDADVVISISASHFVPDRIQRRRKYADSFSRPVLYANLAGGNDYLIFDGGSFAVNAAGELVAQMDFFTEQVALIDLDADPIPESEIDQQEHLYQALALGIRDFAGKNGIQQAFLGLSGGIDSAVVACLAAEALGPEQVTGVAMPSSYTDPRSTQSAEVLASNLGIGFEIVSIGEMHKTAESSLEHLLDEGTGAENLQARLRMIVLMGYVNRHRGMLLNTGNKTEAALGYATLYGDSAGSLCPIGDLTKPEVYALAEWINREVEIIPQFSIDRAPSAELRPDQVDPFDYDDLSPKLEALVQANRSSPAMRLAEHKRAQGGVVLKVSHKAFGPGRQIPITRK